METVYEQLGELRGKLVGLRWQLRHLAIEMDILAKEMTLQENPFAGMTCRAFRELERMAEELNPLYEDVMKELGARDEVTT